MQSGNFILLRRSPSKMIRLRPRRSKSALRSISWQVYFVRPYSVPCKRPSSSVSATNVLRWWRQLFRSVVAEALIGLLEASSPYRLSVFSCCAKFPAKWLLSKLERANQH